jgi:hypothetical protein
MSSTRVQEVAQVENIASEVDLGFLCSLSTLGCSKSAIDNRVGIVGKLPACQGDA